MRLWALDLATQDVAIAGVVGAGFVVCTCELSSVKVAALMVETRVSTSLLRLPCCLHLCGEGNGLRLRHPVSARSATCHLGHPATDVAAGCVLLSVVGLFCCLCLHHNVKSKVLW